jgi:mevalonate kinase
MKVFAPGKLILSGEHAVIYGKPALAMAVNRYVVATVSKQFLPFVSFDFSDLSYQKRLSVRALKKLKNSIKEKYQRFVQGEFKIRDVLQKPVELAQFTSSLFFEMLNVKLKQGIHIHLSSDIPVGCGMGSSAATILSIMHVLAQHLEIQLPPETFLRLGLEAENMQHGFSSGLDMRVSLHGGCLYVHENEIQTRAVPTIPMYLINTGSPESSTGECVAHTAKIFKTTTIGDDFAAVTTAMDLHLQQNTLSEVIRAIQANHQLLIKIGVVPTRVQQFISEIESSGGAAKICGAGAIAGDKAGMVLVITENVTALTALCSRYHFDIVPVAGESRGVHVV